MARSTVRPNRQVPDEWAKYMGVIRRLYLDEEMTLQEVMKIMETEYGFVASVKSYKKRLRDHNYRKNIRSTPSEAQVYENLFASRQRSAHVKLSNGQIVATEHLATHIQRKTSRMRTPATIRPPDRFYFIESAYTHTQQYLLGLSPHDLITETAATNLQEMDPCTQKWGKFVQRLGDALDMSENIHLGEAVVVMRQAPQEFSMILEQKSMNHLGYLYMFLVVATPRRPGISDQELQTFLSIVQSLLNFAATVLAPGHPLQHLLRSLARWEIEDLENFSEKHHECQTSGQFYPLGALAYSILSKKAGPARSSSTPPSPWNPTKIHECDDWLAQEGLHI